MNDWRIGTIGFGYKDWNGSFYPAGSSGKERLTYYARQFNTVEIDSTFYGTPRPAVVTGWAERSADGFRFCPKTPRAISHDGKLLDNVQAMYQFINTMRLLGDKLGPILIQFPPSFRLEMCDVLEAFLRELPGDVRYAVELRHPSWLRGRVVAMMSELNVGWVSADYTAIAPTLFQTTDFFYIRFMGVHGRFEQHRESQLDQQQRLAMWQRQIAPRLDEVDAVYALFNNDFGGHAPDDARLWRRMVGADYQPAPTPVQTKLFD